MNQLVKGIEEMHNIAGSLAAQLAPKPTSATVVALSGDLGAGKTAFAKALARSFGIEEEVTSPTFVIEKIYALPNGPFQRLIHIDAYRLNGAHDLHVLGWRELIQESGNLIILEWPEKVDRAIPRDAHQIRFEFLDENTRTISYDIK